MDKIAQPLNKYLSERLRIALKANLPKPMQDRFFPTHTSLIGHHKPPVFMWSLKYSPHSSSSHTALGENPVISLSMNIGAPVQQHLEAIRENKPPLHSDTAAWELSALLLPRAMETPAFFP